MIEGEIYNEEEERPRRGSFADTWDPSSASCQAMMTLRLQYLLAGDVGDATHCLPISTATMLLV